MLFIVVGNNIPKDWTFDYEFPENGLLPKQLAEKAMEIIDDSTKKDISIRTVSSILIELLDTVAEYYLKTTNIYFLDDIKVNADELYIIYDVLGDLFDNIDRIKLNASRMPYYNKEILVTKLTNDLYE